MIRKAEKLLGWRPIISLEQGLRTTIGYFALRVFMPQEENMPVASRPTGLRYLERFAAGTDEILH